MSWRADLRRSRVVGFALVAAAILILAAALLNYVPPHHHDGKKQSQVDSMGLFQAIEGFASTYGTLPRVAPKGGELVMEGKDAEELLTVLLGKEELNAATQNKKQIRFLNVEETKRREKGGLLYSNGGGGPLPQGLYDAWGRPFRVRLASGEPWEIQDPFKPGEVIREKRVIVFSYGKNGKPGDRDDIKTW